MHVYFCLRSQRAGEEKLSQAISAFADNARPAGEFHGRRTLHVASTIDGRKTFEAVQQTKRKDR